MELYETLRRLRKERGWSQAELGERLSALGAEASQKAVSRWERGASEPSVAQFLGLCELFQVRDVLETFLGRPAEDGALNAAGKRRVREYIRLLEGDAEFSAAPRRTGAPRRSIPLYDLPVSAGVGQFLDSADYELLEVDELAPPSAAFAVRITGDSMTPRYVHRQIVYVRRQQTLERGEAGVFLLNGSAYCKLLGGDASHTELVSINAAYAPIPVSEFDELRVLGKVVG